MGIPQKAPPSPEQIAGARQDYQAGAPLATIKTKYGLTKHEVYFCLDRPPALPRRRVMSRRAAAQTGDKGLVERLWRTARLQVDAVEQRLTNAGLAPDAVERDARALAMLVKTLRELAALEDVRAPDASAGNTDDAVPQDIDEFRRELARRMDAIVAGRKAASPGDSEHGGG